VAGIQYVVLKSGPPSSEHPTRADAVQIHFEGRTMDGRVFDASSRYKNGTAIFPLRLLIPGWVVAVQLMNRGDRWRIYIPPEFAYGRTGTNRLAGQTLAFEIELIDFSPMPPQPPPMLDSLPPKKAP
jgi:FKBP-type peptidyl-prolyl cis-trans isomerase FklB